MLIAYNAQFQDLFLDMLFCDDCSGGSVLMIYGQPVLHATSDKVSGHLVTRCNEPKQDR